MFAVAPVNVAGLLVLEPLAVCVVGPEGDEVKSRTKYGSRVPAHGILNVVVVIAVAAFNTGAGGPVVNVVTSDSFEDSPVELFARILNL